MRKILFAGLVLLSFQVWAVPSSCQDGNFDGNNLPSQISYNEEICHKGFTVLFSEQSKNPAVVGEYLTPQRLQEGANVPRKNLFHADPKLSQEFQEADADDYAHSGYDKGHQAPAGDAYDSESKLETFVMTNMVPQTPNLNRVTWKGIEETVRSEVSSGLSAYVLTGPIYEGPIQTIGNDKIWIPTYSYKAVKYSNNEKVVYVAKNTQAIPAVELYTEDTFLARFKFDPFHQ